jgi:hypothetical protein
MEGTKKLNSYQNGSDSERFLRRSALRSFRRRYHYGGQVGGQGIGGQTYSQKLHD